MLQIILFVHSKLKYFLCVKAFFCTLNLNSFFFNIPNHKHFYICQINVFFNIPNHKYLYICQINVFFNIPNHNLYICQINVFFSTFQITIFTYVKLMFFFSTFQITIFTYAKLMFFFQHSKSQSLHMPN